MPMAFKDTRIWKAWEGIKWLFGAGEKEAVEESTPQQQTDTWSKTLNEVAQDINRNESQTTILNSDPLWQFNKQQEAQAEADKIIDVPTPNPVNTWFVSSGDVEVEWNVNEAVKEREKEKDKSRWEKALDGIGEWVTSFTNFLWDWIKSLNANADYNAEKKDMAMYYDKDSWDVYYLDINTSRWLADWDTWAYDWAQTLFNKAYQEFNYVYNNATTDAEKAEALSNFYTKTKDLFRLRADDYYTDWLLTWSNWKLVGRRKDLYSDEQLDTLSKNNIDLSKRYVPSFEEFLEYVNNLNDNESLRQDIYSSYWVEADADDNSIDLSEWTKKKWNDAFYNKAMTWVMDTAKQYLNESEASEAILTSASLVNSQSSRIQSIVNEVYKYEQLVLAIPEADRSSWDLAILDAANKLREMEELYAWNISDMIIQNIKYWRNSKWELQDNIDVFEWWLSLNQLLTDNIKEVAWWDFNRRDSAIDVFQEVANKALYEYNKDSKWVWAHLQRGWEGVWNFLWELWQQTIYWLMWARNIIADLATLDFDSLSAALEWRAPLSTTANYADNDITYARLLQTDMWNNSRTIYKYWLNWLEYVPEGIGNLAPDIALTIATWGTWAATWVIRWWARANEAIKAWRATWLLNKLIKSAEYSNVAKSALTWIERATALAKAATEISPEFRIWAQLLDAAVTNWIIDQAIDAQWSAFDTEPYSDTSMLISLLWTWLWEIAPIIFKSWIVQNAFWQSWIFDIARYMKTNPDALANIAKATNTTISQLTYEDLRNYLKNFDEITDAAKQVYNWLNPELQGTANKLTKDILYNYLNQFYKLDTQSQVAKDMRRIVTNASTNPADLLKYVGKIPGTVEFWPFVSKIQLKNWTKSIAYWSYDWKLDSLDGWFASRVWWGFSNADIDAISKIDGYSDIAKDKSKYFYEDWNWKYYLTEDWLDHFWLSAENQTLEALWLELAEVEDTKNLFKEKMKSIRTNKKAISDDTVDAIAESWGYQEIVEKVKEIVC